MNAVCRAFKEISQHGNLLCFKSGKVVFHELATRFNLITTIGLGKDRGKCGHFVCDLQS
jgi:hypothetical protein